MKQVRQLILIMLVGTVACVPVVFVWEETGLPRGNPPVWLSDHMTISHADAGYWTRVAAVRDERVTTGPTLFAGSFVFISFLCYSIISNNKIILFLQLQHVVKYEQRR